MYKYLSSCMAMAMAQQMPALLRHSLLLLVLACMWLAPARAFQGVVHFGRRNCWSGLRPNMSSADGREALTGLKVDDLKRLLRGKGLKVSGLKVDLIDRLLSSQEGGGLHSISRKRSRPGDESKSGTDHEKKKSSLPQRANIPRSVTPRTPATNGSGSDGRSLNIISWNVNGLRARLRSAEGRDALRALAVRESAHLICLQETKLNPENVEEATAALRDILPGFSFHFNCSVAKRGYSGTAVLLSPSVPHEVVTVHSGMGHQESDVEGRCLTVHFPNLSVVNVYVPNSGEGLRRLAFRTDEWDPALASHVQKVAEDRGSPCLLVGDLNVAHQDADFFNPEAPYTTLQACTTPQERESFEKRLLKESNLVDAFRSKYPSATGVYSYWSMRARNRPFNRGLRIDLTLISDSAKHLVQDTYVLDQEEAYVGLSDHVPCGVSLGGELATF